MSRVEISKVYAVSLAQACLCLLAKCHVCVYETSFYHEIKSIYALFTY